MSIVEGSEENSDSEDGNNHHNNNNEEKDTFDDLSDFNDSKNNNHSGVNNSGLNEVNKLKPEEVEELRELFNLVDTDRGGSISKEELKQLMDTVGIHATPEELDKMLLEIDENCDGEIQFEEFVAVMSKKVNSSYTIDEVLESFKLFAVDCPPGLISIEQMEIALTQFGTKKLSPEEAKQLCSTIEVDENGMFAYEQYVNLMLSE